MRNRVLVDQRLIQHQQDGLHLAMKISVRVLDPHARSAIAARNTEGGGRTTYNRCMTRTRICSCCGTPLEDDLFSEVITIARPDAIADYELLELVLFRAIPRRDVKPLANTASCEAPHFQYHVSGRLAIRMDDGTEFVAGPGDITSLPSGHDAWVVGDEPAIVVDWFGASNYAKRA